MNKSIALTLSILVPFFLQSQGYFDHLKANYPVYGFTLISGFADGSADVMQFKYDRSVFPQKGQKGYGFWNPKISWERKWKDGNPDLGEAFFTSSTLTVALTDGWHRAKTVRNIGNTCAILSYKQPKKKWYKLIDFCLITLTRSAGWHLANEVLIR